MTAVLTIAGYGLREAVRRKVFVVVCVLTVGYPGGVTKQFSIRAELKPRVQQQLKNYQLLKARLEAICEINHVFLRPEE